MADRPRVLLVLGDSTGGIGRHVHTVAAELRRRGYDVGICGPVTSMRAVRRIRAAASDRDVVHAHGTRAGALAVMTGHPAVVVTWHNAPIGSRPRRVLHALAEWVTARRAALVLAASDDLVDRARRAGAREARLSAVAAPPLPAPVRSGAEVRAELGVGARPLVLAVARLAPQKRLDLLVRASAGWAELPDGPVVVVAGEGPLRPQLEAMASELRSPLRLLGHRDDVADLLSAADVAVLASDWEARPLVAQEALRIGTALVATDVGGVAGLVDAAAVLVPPGDARALGEAIRALLDDPQRRADYVARGRRQAATWPSVADMVDELERCYAEVARRRSTTG